MSAAAQRLDSPALVLPPAFSLLCPEAPASAFTLACSLADRDGAGTLIWAPGEDLFDLAVVLEPEEPLRTARRAFFVGVGAVLDAVGSVAPPEKALTVEWPGTIRFDGARLGGGRLGWPDGCGEDERPAWLVFSATLIASKARAGDPGLTPESTSLEEEGFDAPLAAVAEAFARYLMLGFDTWRTDGFDAAAARYLSRLSGHGAHGVGRIDEGGDLIAGADRTPLLPALREPAWLDPRTGTPRL